MLRENIVKEAPHLNKKLISHRLPNVRGIIFHSKLRILRSPMPNDHPALYSVGEADRKLSNYFCKHLQDV